uniref:Uncharacterized protein n=1 Tax=Sinocyclocheilus grahami TaxID=75366 RepID=A0A672T5J3_SINGR
AKKNYLFCNFKILCGLKITFPSLIMNNRHMGGKCYLVGFATNAKRFVTHHKADMKMATAVMVSFGSCFRMHHLPKKTEITGRFVFDNERKHCHIANEWYILSILMLTNKITEFFNLLITVLQENAQMLKYLIHQRKSKTNSCKFMFKFGKDGSSALNYIYILLL